jgi:hypothetical protein
MGMRLAKKIQSFADRSAALLDELEAMEPGTLRARPLPGKWTILEIVEHIVLAERFVLQGLPEPSHLPAAKPGLKGRLRYLLVLFVLRANIPVGVGSPAMIPQGNRDLAELRGLWNEDQAWVLAYVTRFGSRGLKRAILRHPVTGPITVKQAITLSRAHLDRHIRQIRRLQNLLA